MLAVATATAVGSAIIASRVQKRGDPASKDTHAQTDCSSTDDLGEDTIRGSVAPTEDTVSVRSLDVQPVSQERHKWRRGKKRKTWKEKLEKHCPEATETEYRRFHTAFGKEAREHLRYYLQWRMLHGQNDVEDKGCSDFEDWNDSVQSATEYVMKMSEGGHMDRESGKNSCCAFKRLPQFMFTHTMSNGELLRDPNGYIVIHALPSLIDLQLASEELWVLSILLYFEKKLDRQLDEKLTIVMDVRPGVGWPNLTIGPLLELVRQLTASASKLFPLRLHKCIVFPVPHVAATVWRVIKVVVPKALRKRFIFVGGKDDINSPIPPRLQELFLTKEELDVFEETRIGLFGRRMRGANDANGLLNL